MMNVGQMMFVGMGRSNFLLFFALVGAALVGCETITHSNFGELKAKAEHGDVDAQTNLGEMYAAGQVVARDTVEAARWYRTAARHGDAAGQFKLGQIYQRGRGATKDEAEAVKWFRKAAMQDFAPAQCSLGAMYAEARGVIRNDAEAVKWYRKAAVQNDSDAQTNLGWMYAQGRGVPKDDAEAVKWYRKAAEQGDVDAQGWLGSIYGSGGKGVAKDQTEAARWYHKAEVTERKEVEELLSRYRPRAEQGDAEAQFTVGCILKNHTGKGASPPTRWEILESIKWWRRAAEQGHVFAQYFLGQEYLHGNSSGGVPYDFVEVYTWWSLYAANAKGKEQEIYKKGSFQVLERIAPMMTPGQLAEAKKRVADFVPKKNPPVD